MEPGGFLGVGFSLSLGFSHRSAVSGLEPRPSLLLSTLSTGGLAHDHAHVRGEAAVTHVASSGEGDLGGNRHREGVNISCQARNFGTRRI
jgi:hypothetical protein